MNNATEDRHCELCAWDSLGGAWNLGRERHCSKTRLKIQQGTRYLFSRVLTSFHGGPEGRGSSCSVGDPSSIPGSGRSPEERNVFLPEEFHGQRSLSGYSP